VRGGTQDFLRSLGVAELPPATSPFDPGYDPVTVEAHLEQSAHLISVLKISMACWLVAEEGATRRKFAAARRHGVRTTTGGGPYEVAVAQGRLDAYLDLCADVGAARIECGSGFTEARTDPGDVVARAQARGLEVQYELGSKHGGAFDSTTVGELVAEGRRWLDAGAVQLVIEARESASDVGLFDAQGGFDPGAADEFADAFGLDVVSFEAPNKPSQFALLDHFGPEVNLCNVRLEELLRVEIYRRGLHSDAFRRENLRPRLPGVHAGDSTA
jgi:phosphosulfolactate synthase